MNVELAWADMLDAEYAGDWQTAYELAYALGMYMIFEGKPPVGWTYKDADAECRRIMERADQYHYW
jgi:hypothetical protein